MSKNERTERKYWASASAKTCVDMCEQKRNDFYQWLYISEIRNVMRRSWFYYNSALTQGTYNIPTGNNGEFLSVHINDYRNILQNVFTMVISQRPAWEPKATNADAKSMAQVKTAKNVLDNVMRTKHLEEKFYKMVEFAGTIGEGFMEITWDALAGREVIPETDDTAAVKEGDIDTHVCSTIDVVRDIHADSWENNEWVIVRKYENKYNLANRYPEYYDRIVGISSNTDNANLTLQHYRMFWKKRYDTDRIPYYTFYHKRTLACPSGREIIYIDDSLILEDKPLAYRDIPLFRVSGGEMDGINVGYSPAWDAINIQELINTVHTAIATNIKSFAVNNVVAPKGTGIPSSYLVGNLNFIELDQTLGGEIKVLELLKISPDVWQYLQICSQKMEQMLQTNSAARGQPPQGVESGSALAQLQSIAVQFNQQLQQRFIEVFEASGTMILDLMKLHANAPRLIEMTGKSNRSFISSFESKDIEGIDRVVADLGNPALKTIQGKAQFAQQLAQAGLVVNAQQLLNVWEFGTLDPITDAGENDQINIEKENEYLMDGKNITPLIYDNHREHILRHLANIADPAEREADSPGAKATLAHIDEHFKMLADPEMQQRFQLLGFLPQQQPPQGEQHGGNQPKPQGGGQPGRPHGVGQKPGGNPQLPSLPGLPNTGAKPPAGAANAPKPPYSPTAQFNSNA